MNGGAKASDHDADGGSSWAMAGRERSDEYRSAAKRAEKAAGSEQGGDAGAVSKVVAEIFKTAPLAAGMASVPAETAKSAAR